MLNYSGTQPNITGVFIRREVTQTNIQRQIQVIPKVETRTLGTDGNTRAKRKAWNRFFPRAFKENMVLMTP